MSNFFDPQFYEYQALADLAKSTNSNVIINYKIPDYSLPYSKRNELDGLIEHKDGSNLAIEIKSYPLSCKETDVIKNKLQRLGYKRHLIIAPEFESIKKDLCIFQPNVKTISKMYNDGTFNLPPLTLRELENGKHNFRFRLLYRSKERQYRYINQTDKKINSSKKLLTELTNRLPKENPPVKILWSTSRWFSPKDHFYRKRDNIYLGSPLVFDIDGSKAHSAYFPCEIIPKSGLCEKCIYFSRREAIKLTKLLREFGMEQIETYFSGRSGFHIYVFDVKDQKIDLLFEKIKENKIKIDETVSLNQKSEIAFPMSINAISGYQLEHIENIDEFWPSL